MVTIDLVDATRRMDESFANVLLHVIARIGARLFARRHDMMRNDDASGKEDAKQDQQTRRLAKGDGSKRGAWP